MAVELYRHISATRTGEGKLWTSTTGIDHLGNDWALLSTPFVYYMTEATLSSAGAPSWSTRETMEVGFPDDWALDDDFDSLELAFAITIQTRTGSSTTDAQMRLEEGGNTSNVITVGWTTYGADTRPYLILTYASGSEPTGQTTINIQAQWLVDPVTDTLYFKRDDTDLDCYLLVRKV
jgi:hypothetical protein